MQWVGLPTNSSRTEIAEVDRNMTDCRQIEFAECLELLSFHVFQTLGEQVRFALVCV